MTRPAMFFVLLCEKLVDHIFRSDLKLERELTTLFGMQNVKDVLVLIRWSLLCKQKANIITSSRLSVFVQGRYVY